MSKVIWLINEYAGSPYHGMGTRHFYLAKGLEKLGFKVYIITASFSHLLTKPPQIENSFKYEKIENVNYVWIKVPPYDGGKDRKRMYKWFIFSARLFLLRKRRVIHEKPNFIIASTPELFHLIPAYKLAKEFEAKFIYEVRDIWPLSLVEIGNISERNPLIWLMKRIERFSYAKADVVISLLPNLSEYLIENNIKVKRLEIIPNGVCIEDLQLAEPLPKWIRNKIPKNKFIVIYTGTLGKANALEHLIKTANILRTYQDIYFLIVGKGSEKDRLIKLTEKLNLRNVSFLPAIPKRQVQTLLQLADVCYIGLRKKSIFKYGVSPNKLFDYMFAAKPIIYAINSGNKPVDEAKCGISVEAENSQAIAKAIIKLYKLSPEERKILGENGRRYLLQNYTYKSLAYKLGEILNDLSKS